MTPATPPAVPPAEPLLRVQGLSQQYRLPRRHLLQPAPVVQALSDVSFTLERGRSLGVVGESGSGKSTLARLVMALEAPTAGQVWLDGQPLHSLPPAALRALRARFQMVFQDPFGSLDPRVRIGVTVGEPLSLLPATRRQTPAERARQVAEALDAVGLHAADAEKYPHEFSGGQRQRIALARALITRPALIVADEPVSALDVSVQAQVLNLMQDLQEQLGLSYLFISHDLGVVSLVCDDVIVLQEGRVVEAGRTAEVFRQPRHPYTRELLRAVPGAEQGLAAVAE